MTTQKALSELEQRHRAEHEASEQRIQEALTPFVEALIDADESRRKLSVEHALRTCQPQVLVRLVHRLVSLLGSDPVQRREQAIASLAQLGSISVRALTSHFARTHSGLFQEAIIEALSRVGRSLFTQERIELLEEVALLMPAAANDFVRRRLVGLLGMLRRANERGKRWES